MVNSALKTITGDTLTLIKFFVMMEDHDMFRLEASATGVGIIVSCNFPFTERNLVGCIALCIL
jgi:hypothetical protein